MKATEQLRKEHETVRFAMRVMDSLVARLEQGETVPSAHLEQLLDFISIFTDQCHHGKEEEIFFPALESVGIPVKGGPIGMMLQEHEIMRGHIRALKQAADRWKPGNDELVAVIVQNARTYLTWLDSHIDKENNILFAMADMHLSESRQKSLFEEFERLESDRIGEGVHEQLHKTLHHLADIYLTDIDEMKEPEEKLVAWKIPPKTRHAQIFQRFEGLHPGENFILENDHDPKPLFYQFQIERAGQFAWEYLQEGPDLWQVRIGKTEQVNQMV